LIGLVLVGAGRQVVGRLLDAADPEIVGRAGTVAATTPGVLDVEEVRLRWSGRGQFAELTVVVDRKLSLLAAHEIAHRVEHELLHHIPRLIRAHVHPHPAPVSGQDDHAMIAHHTRQPGLV